MNIRGVFALALVGVAASTGCSMDESTEGADEAPEPVAEVGQASTAYILKYGNTLPIQNDYLSWAGGYLDTRASGCEDNYLCVSTADSSDRDQGSGGWTIESATGAAAGSPVLNGDLIHLQNAYLGNGGYLDVRGSGCEENLLCVSTSTSSDRDSGSGTWQILAVNGDIGTPVEGWQEVRFLNGYLNFTGGYLDTRASGCEENFLCVSTSATADRDSGSTHWRVWPPPS
jgi:hypothetical protein